MGKGFLFFALVSVSFCFSQTDGPRTSKAYKHTLDINQFYGSVLLHNPDVSHLIAAHPGGLILGYNKKTYGHEDWEARYNYPDLGYSFVYQDMNNEELGRLFSAYAHYNFYFFRRHMMFRIGQGIAYATNPYHRETNFRNNAYGSRFLSSTFLMFNFHKANIVQGLGVMAGISLIHYSNANVKAPNTSTNTFAFNLGLTYDLHWARPMAYLPPKETKGFGEPLRYNLVFRGGINESDIIGSGQYPFYIFSAYADKRLGRKSAVQLGADLFLSNFLREQILYESIAFPEKDVAPDTDYKRAGIFVGHELFISKMSIIAQLGYYIYYPVEFEGRLYNRVGMKRYFGKKLFGALTLKSHAAAAEAVEFGIGVRL